MFPLCSHCFRFIIPTSMLSSLKEITRPHSLLGDFHCLPVDRGYFSSPCWGWPCGLLWPIRCDCMKCAAMSVQVFWMCHHGLVWPLVLMLSAMRTACSSWGLFPQSWNEKTMWSRAEHCCVRSREPSKSAIHVLHQWEINLRCYKPLKLWGYGKN